MLLRFRGDVRLALVVLLWLLLAARAPTTTQPAAVLRWAWSGGVTARTATIKARVSAPGSIVTLVTTRADGGPAEPLVLDTTADAHGIAAFDVAGLAPRTRYAYRVQVAPGAILSGGFRTFADGAMDATIAFASCARTGSASPVFDAIRAAQPDLFIHMGDFHYRNISGNQPDRFRLAYDEVMASPAQGRLYRAVPIAYVWDDHDFGANDANGTSRSRPAALVAYRQFVPHYPLAADGEEGIFQALDLGRVRVIVTDARSRRSPSRHQPASQRTMLGVVQRQWLLDQFSAAVDRPLVVWVSSVAWIAPAATGADHWGSYADERAIIATHLDRLGLTSRVVMLSGDAHMAALDDGTHSHYGAEADNGPGFVVAHAAPLDRFTIGKGGPYSHGTSRKRGQFGLLKVTDRGEGLQVEVTARNRAGGQIPGMRIAMSCDGGRSCTVLPSASR